VHAKADVPSGVVSDPELGSYARYLMLNGATRDEAIAAARNIDHPTVRVAATRHARASTDAAAPERQ
jgi:hypothetical protein